MMFTLDRQFAIGFALGLLAAIGMLSLFRLVLPWWRAFASGYRVSFVWVLGCRLRMHPVHLLLDAYFALRASERNVSIIELERFYISNKLRIRDANSLVEKYLEQTNTADA